MMLGTISKNLFWTDMITPYFKMIYSY